MAGRSAGSYGSQGAGPDLLRRARLVVIALGPGRSLEWELLQAVRAVPPDRLMLLILMSANSYADLRKKLNRAFRLEVGRLRRDTGDNWSPPVLPARLSAPRSGPSEGWFIQFGQTWIMKSSPLGNLGGYTSYSRKMLQERLSLLMRPVLENLAPGSGAGHPRGTRLSGTFDGLAPFILFFGPLIAFIVGDIHSVGYAISVVSVMGAIIAYGIASSVVIELLSRGTSIRVASSRHPGDSLSVTPQWNM